jgi:N-acetylmuramoyl-L-alanine amidase
VRPGVDGPEIYNGNKRQPRLRFAMMGTRRNSHAWLQRAAVVTLLCSMALAASEASARTLTHAGTHASAFDRAERLRASLEMRPMRQRTPDEYAEVMDAYRAIYRNNPGDPHADAAVDAVAGLLAEEGRLLHERRLLEDAVGQYAFLRRTYPESRFRENAMLRQAQIEKSDLHDSAAAAGYFAEFQKQYPNSVLLAQARPHKQTLASSSRAEQAAENAREHARELAELNSVDSAPGPSRAARRANPGNAMTERDITPPSPAIQPTAAPVRNGPPVVITGIRHWSTPIYTRVAIDLSGEVSYEAARVPNPDRIYFDLHGARLAQSMVGRAVDVTDDGYLHRVRAAQYAADSTRVVLDVSHVSEYSAFLLPNPWRLIIDIHGAAANGAVLFAQNDESNAPMPAPASAAPKKIKTAQQDVASLSSAPTRVKATHHPTTGPIAASVHGTTRAAQPNELEDLGSAASARPPAITPTPSTQAAATLQVVKHPRHKSATSNDTQVATNIAPPAPSGPFAPEIPAAGVHEAVPTSTGERSLVRALGLKIGRIVIDAGHGGHDSGTLGPGGIQEKDVVLDVALRLGKLLKQRLGANVIYTRSDDTFIPLETRTAIANKAQADLFISVHANSSSDPSARGVEVYYLNFTTSPEALEVAARENAVSDQSIYQLSDLVKKITLKDKIDESHEFAADVENSLYSGLEQGNAGLKDRGVKKAPFVVLIGANMPSILAEISFLTNPDDARQLRDPAYRERIAESLYRGVSRYVSGLSGMRIAQNGRGGQ